MIALLAVHAALCTLYLQIVPPIGPLGPVKGEIRFKSVMSIEAIDPGTRTITARVKDGNTLVRVVVAYQIPEVVGIK